MCICYISTTIYSYISGGIWAYLCHIFPRLPTPFAHSDGVVIRTESLSTTVTINSPDDVVKHYGTAGSLNIIAVKSTSYHEFGKVAFAEIKTGRMVLEEESKVTHIHLTATDTGADAHFNDITVAKAGSVTMPAFSRDPVDIPEGGRLVVSLQDGTETTDEKDYVWLTAVGIYEQVTVSDSKTEAGNSYAADSSNQEKKDTAAQIANNITFSEGDDNYKVTAKTTDGGTTWTYEVVDQNGSVAEDYSATKDNTENTVNVQTTGASPTDVETTKENGMTPEEKQAAKEEAVEEAVVEEIEEDDKYVARIGTTPFESLKDAVAGAAANDVIEMTANDLSTENISVNKVLTIRMNEKTFGGTIVVATTGTNAVTVVGQANVDAVIKLGNRYFNAFVTANNGTVTLMKDITMSQIYKHDYSGTAKNWGVDLNGHTITLTNNNSEGGVYVGSYYGTNHTLSFSNGNLVFTGTSSSAVAMEVYGNLNLNNVNVTSSCGTAIKAEAGNWDGPAHVTITGGSIVSQGKGLDLGAYKSGTTIKQSTAVLTNVTISAKNEGVKSNGASCTIESCSISSTNSHAVSTFNSSSGSNPSQVIISGNSSIAASSAHAINCTSGTLQISGNAELNGTVYVQSSAMTIAGGVYHGNFSLGGSGQLTIAGGTYNGNLINVTQAGRLLVIGETQFEELVTYSITGSNGSYEVVAQ